MKMLTYKETTNLLCTKPSKTKTEGLFVIMLCCITLAVHYYVRTIEEDHGKRNIMIMK